MNEPCFAHDLVVQELTKRGVRLLTASGGDLTDSDDLRCARSPALSWNTKWAPGRQRGARGRKRKETGKKVGGRKSRAELWPEVVAEARVPSEGEGQNWLSELPKDQRQAAEGSRLLQRARPTLQPSVGASNDRGTAASAAPAYLPGRLSERSGHTPISCHGDAVLTEAREARYRERRSADSCAQNP